MMALRGRERRKILNTKEQVLLKELNAIFSKHLLLLLRNRKFAMVRSTLDRVIRANSEDCRAEEKTIVNTLEEICAELEKGHSEVAEEIRKAIDKYQHGIFAY